MTAVVRDMVSEELQTSLRPGVAMHPAVRSPEPHEEEEELTESATETAATPPGEATETVGESMSEGQCLISASVGQVLPVRTIDTRMYD